MSTLAHSSPSTSHRAMQRCFGAQITGTSPHGQGARRKVYDTSVLSHCNTLTQRSIRLFAKIMQTRTTHVENVRNVLLQNPLF